MKEGRVLIGFALLLAVSTVKKTSALIGLNINGDRLIVATRMSKSSAVTDGSASISSSNVGSWSYLQQRSIVETAVGKALEIDKEQRLKGQGEAHVSNILRLFDQLEGYQPRFTLYRDEAGWCPYCQKTMLLIEEKRIPINIKTVPMRSYGDKPREFLQMVPNGLLPALVIHDHENSNQKRVMTESQRIMEFLDQQHPQSLGYQPMLPIDPKDLLRYQYLVQLERNLFGCWCSLVFRPEPRTTANSNMSPAMSRFMDCLDEVNQALSETDGPWFFDFRKDGPTMIDFIYISHVERMLASCAYWKGLDIRSAAYGNRWNALQTWLNAFDQRPSYLGFKSDYYTNVMDIPPQYGPGYDGGFESNRVKFQSIILGRENDGALTSSWKLPLPHDDDLQPLYKGLPLPLCALEAGGILDYKNADPQSMAKACRHAGAWKLASNGINVARFAARGGIRGSKNLRKQFDAPLADPYAIADELVLPEVDEILRVVCYVMLSNDDDEAGDMLEEKLKGMNLKHSSDVVSSLLYLRDRIGVPRDMPLAAARYLRAYLNRAIHAVYSNV